VSTIATGEPLHVALQFRPSVKPARTAPWYQEQLDWSEAVLGLVFVVEGRVLLHNKAAYVPIGGVQPFSGWFYRRATRAVGN
jgi:hypothetical protein